MNSAWTYILRTKKKKKYPLNIQLNSLKICYSVKTMYNYFCF